SIFNKLLALVNQRLVRAVLGYGFEFGLEVENTLPIQNLDSQLRLLKTQQRAEQSTSNSDYWSHSYSLRKEYDAAAERWRCPCEYF
ncbi:MAG: hypothetical protein AAGL17_23195, partial [Cyanobacteria bacterium J06576_12]